MKNTYFFLVTVFLFFFNCLSAQVFQTIDNSFGEEGEVIVDGGVYKVTILSDGKFMLVGRIDNGLINTNGFNADFSLVRLNANGALDESFGDGGKIVIESTNADEYLISLVIQPDNKIIFGGRVKINSIDHYPIYNYFFIRCHPDGTIDRSFGEEGRLAGDFGGFSTTVHQIKILPDGKILVSGKKSIRNGEDDFTYSHIVKRFSINGIIDKDFGVDGQVETKLEKDKLSSGWYADYRYKGVQYQTDFLFLFGSGGNKVLSENDFTLTRFHLDGTLDTLFGNRGTVTTDFGYSGGEYASRMVFQSDGKIILMGRAVNRSKDDFALVRYHVDGTIDESFGIEGKVTTEFSNSNSIVFQSDDTAYDIMIEEDGKILVMGNSVVIQGNKRELALARYNVDGSLDETFGNKGKLIIPKHNSNTFLPYFFLLQKDKKIVVGGIGKNQEGTYNDFILMRFLSKLNVGTLNFSLNNNPTLVYPNPIQKTTTLEYKLEQPETLTIQLLDLNGKIIKTFVQSEMQKAGEYHQEIDMPVSLAKGVYFLRLTSSNGQVSIKIVK